MRFLYHPQAYLALCLSVSSCHIAPRSSSKPQAEGRRVGDYRGYRAVSESLEQHVLAGRNGGNWSLSKYVGVYSSSSYSPSFAGLLSLLGGYSGTGANNAVQGGEPNAMTMLLWDTMLSGLAADIGSLCTPDQNDSIFSLAIDPIYVHTVMDICPWPAAEAMTREHLQTMWTATLGYEASEEEKNAWVDGVLAADSGFASLKGADAVRAIARSMLLNPHYLLEE